MHAGASAGACLHAARYGEYVAHFRRTSARFGAEIIYYGHGRAAMVAEPGQAWDAVLLVRYPSRKAFSDMVRDPAYQAGTHLRSEALVEAVLQPTVDATAGAVPADGTVSTFTGAVTCGDDSRPRSGLTRPRRGSDSAVL